MTVVSLATVALAVLIWLGTSAFLRLRKKKTLVYLLFFSIFFVYLYNVLDYTLFQYQSLLLLKYFSAHLKLNGQAAGNAVNLIPLLTLTSEDLKTSLLNILLLLPFGFGLPFVARLRARGTIGTGALVSVGIEFLQFLTGFLAGMTFRVADVNDVLFNTLGVAVGYGLFRGFVRLYRRVSRNWQTASNPLLQYLTSLGAEARQESPADGAGGAHQPRRGPGGAED